MSKTKYSVASIKEKLRNISRKENIETIYRRSFIRKCNVKISFFVA